MTLTSIARRTFGALVLAGLLTGGCAMGGSPGIYATNGEQSRKTGETVARWDNKPIKITLPESVVSQFLIPVEHVPANLKKDFSQAAKSHLTPPMSSLVDKLLSTGVMRLAVLPAGEVLVPSVELLKANGCSKENIDAVSSTKTFIVIVTANPLPEKWSESGEILARAAAGAMAIDCHSVVFDSQELVVLDGVQISKTLPPHGSWAQFKDCVKVFVSSDKSGLWLTTNGLKRFGLPELQALEVPPQLSNQIGFLITGLARKIVILSEQTTKTGGTKIFELPPSIEVNSGDIAAAYGDKSDKKGSALIGLRLDKAKSADSCDFLTIVAPSNQGVTSGEYFASIATQLFGKGEDKLITVSRTKEMDAAMNAAKETLPDIRTRYLANKLPTGALLLVKFGAPAGSNTEYLWAYVDGWDDPKTLACHCANDSDWTPKYKVGMPLQLNSDTIVDWSVIVKGEVVEGDRTTKVLEKDN